MRGEETIRITRLRCIILYLSQSRPHAGDGDAGEEEGGEAGEAAKLEDEAEGGEMGGVVR